ncbi:MAG TPA: hypothetical protein VI796_03810 [Candidatus Thermoplasmatota archaeon]|nr:hypothetical protein [Candidatus Thermoplasmatota archaeon]
MVRDLQGPSTLHAPRMSLLLLLPFATIGVSLLVGMSGSIGHDPGEMSPTAAVVVQLLLGLLLMWVGWSRVRRFPGEFLVVAGASLWSAPAYFHHNPLPWMAIPGALLVLAIPFLDFAADTRLALSITAFLALDNLLSLSGVEEQTGSWTLIALAVVLLLAWASLPASGTWRKVPLSLGLLLGSVGTIAGSVYLVSDPTWGRGFLVTASLALASGLLLLWVRPSLRDWQAPILRRPVPEGGLER